MTIGRIFRTGTKYDKQMHHTPNGYYLSIVEHSYFLVKNTKEAKARKDLYAGFFSKAAIQRLEDLIHQKVDHFTTVMDTTGKTAVNLTLGYMCLTSEIIMDYSFRKPLGALEAPGFRFPLILAIQQFFSMNYLTHYFPAALNSMAKIVTSLPTSMQGPFAHIMALKTACRNRVVELKERMKVESVATMMDVALNPDAEKAQRQSTLDELNDDMLMTFVAGTDTTATTLCQGTYAIVSNPSVNQRLKEELQGAIRSKSSKVSLSMLKNLPYLVSSQQ